jgi:hypothetical protein
VLLNGPQKAAELKKETTKKELRRERKEYAKIRRRLFCCRRSRIVLLSFLLQRAKAVGSSPTTQVEPLWKQFQIVLLERLWVVFAGSERQLCAKLTLLVTKKEKKGLSPLSRFQHNGVSGAIAETLFLF